MKILLGAAVLSLGTVSTARADWVESQAFVPSPVRFPLIDKNATNAASSGEVNPNAIAATPSSSREWVWEPGGEINVVPFETRLDTTFSYSTESHSATRGGNGSHSEATIQFNLGGSTLTFTKRVNPQETVNQPVQGSPRILLSVVPTRTRPEGGQTVYYLRREEPVSVRNYVRAGAGWANTPYGEVVFGTAFATAGDSRAAVVSIEFAP